MYRQEGMRPYIGKDTLWLHEHIQMTWENSPGFVLLVGKLTLRHLNGCSNAEALKSQEFAVLMLHSQRVPVHTSQHAL